MNKNPKLLEIKSSSDQSKNLITCIYPKYYDFKESDLTTNASVPILID